MSSKEKKYTERPIKSFLKGYPTTVYDSLLGNALANKNLVVLEGHCVIMRRDHKSMKGKVKIIGGGGAGTEPSDAYYVGKGMLTAAVVGEVFTAPSAYEILLALRELSIDNPDGVLLLVKNYTGDKLNFRIAAEQALSENIIVKMLIIGDDVFHHIPARYGRKGLAGSVLIYKIIGEMAEQGKALDEITEAFKELLNNLATVSVTMVPCDSFKPLLKQDELILGVGIYGKGGAKIIEFTTLQDTVSLMLNEILSFLNLNSTLIQDLIVMINNVGATTKLEEAVITKEVYFQLFKLGFKVAKLYVGRFLTSMQTQGFSVSILKTYSSDIIKYLSALTSAPAWPESNSTDLIDFELFNLPITILPEYTIIPGQSKCQNAPLGPIVSEKATAAIKLISVFAAEAIISCEKQLNTIDSEVGDGDAGTVLKRGAEAFRKAVIDDKINLLRPSEFLLELSEICCNHMGGLTGALYKVFFKAAAIAFQNSVEITPELCCTAFREAVNAVKYYGNAEVGDRTILDVLYPALDSFESACRHGKNLPEAVYLAAITSFQSDVPSHHPSIFLWEFLNEEEANFIVRNELSSVDLMNFIEKKIETNQTLLTILLLQTIKFCRKNYKKDPRRTSALVGTVYYTHQYFVASRWRTSAEVYFYFRESILSQSVESPPASIEIFEPEEAKDALIFFFESYIRNLPITSILHLPHYRLQLKLKPDKLFKDQANAKDKRKK